MHLNNNENRDILVKWKEIDEVKNGTIPAGGALVQEFVVKADTEPDKVVFTAYDPSNMAIVSINGKQDLVITPSIQKNRVTANIGTGAGKHIIYILTCGINILCAI